MVSKKIAVVMGSDSDWPVVEKAVRQLEALGIETEVRVMSAHRTPEASRPRARRRTWPGPSLRRAPCPSSASP